jgi:hypothetical protein
MAEDDETDKELSLLFQTMGIVLTRWQSVEDAHYLLFVKMLGAPKEEICSVLYFSPPSFESRRVMVDRVAHFFLQDAAHKREWKDLNKRLETGASERGRIAHYSLDFEISPGPTGTLADMTLHSPRLKPSRYNQVAVLQGKGRDNPKHKLSTKELHGYIISFTKLSVELGAFAQKIALPPPQQGLGLLSGLLPHLGSQPLGSPFPLLHAPLDKPPSEK